jgi:hypothetical protein
LACQLHTQIKTYMTSMVASVGELDADTSRENKDGATRRMKLKISGHPLQRGILQGRFRTIRERRQPANIRSLRSPQQLSEENQQKLLASIWQGTAPLGWVNLMLTFAVVSIATPNRRFERGALGVNIRGTAVVSSF